VRSSVLGEAGGGTMFCRKRSWEAAKFPRNLFYESRSRRGRVLMHSKVCSCVRTPQNAGLDVNFQLNMQMIIATFLGAESPLDNDPGSDSDSDVIEVKGDQGDIVGYAYVGSHNFTPSAWGTLSGSGFTPTLNVNYLLLSQSF
jgi:tyrosyl-DNA phosphodiesterase 1